MALRWWVGAGVATASFSPFTGRRCRQADEGRRRLRQLANFVNAPDNAIVAHGSDNPTPNRP
ncbi:MAG: hypothetical protein E5W03_12175 [Mesorhizobium sp.]|nr:MAG: hypothetical protein E5W03_12175 [Mesorhizobium sp.]